jgi:4-hydroxy-3-polyprenylbenzoate decarboxylase
MATSHFATAVRDIHKWRAIRFPGCPDGGRFITLPCVHTRDPRTGKRNIDMYREALRAAAAVGAEADPTLSASSARVAMMAESAGGATGIPENL